MLERRPSVAARFNVVQLAALSLARLDTFKASEAADAESVLKSMMDGGVLGKVGNFHSRIEARTGKPTSERSKDLDLASPCGRIIELKIDIAGREWEGGKWAKQLKGDQKFKEVQESLFGAPYAVYIW